jgi:hypothetical protein
MGLCTKTESSQQKLEAMIWTFGARHCRKITPSATDADFGDYFDLNVIAYGGKVEKKYLVFIDDSVAVAPTPAADQTLISVSVTIGDSAAVKAGKISAELLAQSVEARTLVAGDDIEIQNFFVGLITVEDTANAADMTFSIAEAGFGGYVGQTDPTELTTTIASVVIMDDAQGETPQDEIITGYTIELPLPLKEMTTQRWVDLIGKVTGNVITIDGKEIVGFGTKKIFQSLFQYAGRLVGHPVRNDITNIDEDITILNTAPKFDNTNFSGGEIQVGNFNFSAYKDANAPEEINLMARGDHSKF